MDSIESFNRRIAPWLVAMVLVLLGITVGLGLVLVASLKTQGLL